MPESNAAVRYMPIGDSYTIGSGISSDDAWPSLLAKSLRADGVNIQLIGNPARIARTSADAIAQQLPLYEEARPNFSTLFIGVNDEVQGVDEETFRANLAVLLDRMLAVLPGPERLIAATIPDYSVTPAGEGYADGKDVAAALERFNAIIREEAAKRRVAVVEFADIAAAMRQDPSMIAGDGLHPSEAGHRFWEAMILPVARKALKTNEEPV